MGLPLEQCRLYTFIDAAYLGSRQPAEIAGQLCDGGSDLIQLRAKNASAAEVCRLAGQIKPVLDNAGVSLVINDHWDIACKIGADYCHLGQEDFFGAGLTDAAELRPLEIASPLPLVGLSTHAPAQAEQAIAAHPAYIAIGPIYATPTKPTAVPVTLDYVRWAAANVTIPWFAIGGINLTNLDAVLEAGATRICVVSAILNAPNLAEACRKFKQRL